jgi:hypothetical protein
MVCSAVTSRLRPEPDQRDDSPEEPELDSTEWLRRVMMLEGDSSSPDSSGDGRDGGQRKKEE